MTIIPMRILAANGDPAKYTITAAVDSVAPMPWANRLGGPAVGRSGSPRRGVTTRVTSCPNGLRVGPVRTRATNP